MFPVTLIQCRNRKHLSNYIRKYKQKEKNVQRVEDWSEELLCAFFTYPDKFIREIQEDSFVKLKRFYTKENKKKARLKEDDSWKWLVKHTADGNVVWKTPLDVSAYPVKTFKSKIFLRGFETIGCVNNENGGIIWLTDLQDEISEYLKVSESYRGDLRLSLIEGYPVASFRIKRRQKKSSQIFKTCLVVLNPENGELLLFKRFQGSKADVYFDTDNIFVIDEDNGNLHYYSFSK